MRREAKNTRVQSMGRAVSTGKASSDHSAINTMSNESVSVVIATYPPDFKLLKIALLNLKWQTVQPFEVVIGASECSDMLARDIEHAASKLNLSFEVRVIPEELPCNAGKNRNRALQHARGNLVMIMDSDDLVHDKKIEVCLQMFRRFLDMKLIVHNFADRPPGDMPIDTEYWAPELPENPRIVGPSSILSGGQVAPSADQPQGLRVHHGHVMLRREVFTRVQYHEEAAFNTGEDCTFYRDTISTFPGGVYYIDLKLVLYSPKWPTTIDPEWDAFSAGAKRVPWSHAARV